MSKSTRYKVYLAPFTSLGYALHLLYNDSKNHSNDDNRFYPHLTHRQKPGSCI